jgi:spore photoproduct lyase
MLNFPVFTSRMGDGMEIEIRKIYVDQDVERAEISQRILSKLPRVEVEIVKTGDRERLILESQKLSISEGKKYLWITSFKGGFVKPCPGTGRDYICCGYYVINEQMNCPLDCSYCVLQGYLNQRFITVYANVSDIAREISQLVDSRKGHLIRIGTGELTDSLALDPWTGFNQDLIEKTAALPIILELKTKTGMVRHLPTVARRNIVLSWSINPSEVISSEEHKSAILEERIQSAVMMVKKGYRLGFHLDPIIECENWQEKYGRLIRYLTASVTETDVMWLSLGALRFPPHLKPIMEKRFPKTKITGGELIQGQDGKMRYFRPEREKLFRFIYQEIRSRWKNIFIYFCMENKAVWDSVMGFSPDSNELLDQMFQESIERRFPDLRVI